MKFRGLYRRRQLRWRTTIAISAAIGVPLAAIGGPLTAFAVDSPPTPNVLVAPAAPLTQGANVLYSQSFTGTDTQPGDWIAGGKACLTAAKDKVLGGIPACDWKTPDAAGGGALRLTGNTKSEAGFALYQRPLQTSKGANIQFDMYQYKALNAPKSPGADGISFFLVDGTASPAKPGQYGRALGYAGTADGPGLQGAVVGIGFDEFGNFSVTGTGHAGGTAKPVPDAVVARGAQGTQYAYLDGKKSPVTFWFDTKDNRGSAKVHVEIEISSANAMTVYLGSKEVLGPLDLGKLSGQPKLPPTVKFGFAASTGANAAIHEISGLSISTLRPSLVTTVSDSGSFTAGGSGTITVGVANAKTAGPTDQPVTVAIPLAAGLTATAASGSGWGCDIGTGQVTCTRSDALAPGTSYPPVTVTTAIAGSASGSIPVTVTAATPDQQMPSDNVATDTISVAVRPVPAAQLTTTITPVGTFTSPGTGTYQANVSNVPTAGPTTGTTTEVFTVPAGQTVTGATGTGWTCTISGQQVTCTTAATVQPGDSFPPVTITASIPSGAGGNASPSATVTTAGQSTPSSAPSLTIKVTPTGQTPAPVTTPAALTTTITAVGAITAPGTATYQANVSNAPAAGPTTGTTTEVFAVPAGQTVKSAAGSGWQCSISGQQVTCTTSAGVQPGGSFPPVTVIAGVPAGAAGSTSPTATVSTTGQAGPSAAPPVSIPVTPAVPAPSLGVSVTPVGAFTSPGTGTYRLNVGDDAAAGPTTGTTTVSFTVPAGQTPASATGTGWQCSISGQQVTCTTSAAVAPGGSFPPVLVGVSIPAGAAGSVSPTAAAKTGGVPGQSVSPTVTIPVIDAGTGGLTPPRGPDLAVAIVPQGQLISGDNGTLQLAVSNSATAGPTTGMVTATYSVPGGSEVTAASGTGWTCAIQRWLVTCTRPGTGGDALAAGGTYPPVSLVSALCHKAVCTLAAVSANVNSPGDATTGGSTLTENLSIQRQSSVQVTMVSAPSPYQAGRPVTYTVTVSNAGPTDSAGGTVGIAVPAGFSGAWTCTATPGSGCAEPIAAGSAKVTTYVAAGGTVTLTATGTAPGTAGGPASASVSLSPGYTDTVCRQTCTATVLQRAILRADQWQDVVARAGFVSRF